PASSAMAVAPSVPAGSAANLRGRTPTSPRGAPTQTPSAMQVRVMMWAAGAATTSAIIAFFAYRVARRQLQAVKQIADTPLVWAQRTCRAALRNELFSELLRLNAMTIANPGLQSVYRGDESKTEDAQQVKRSEYVLYHLNLFDYLVAQFEDLIGSKVPLTDGA